MTDSIQDFIDAGIERLYPDKWKRLVPFISVIEAGEIGIVVIHDREVGVLSASAGVLSGLTFSPDLVRDVANLNMDTVLGAYVLSEGQPGYWMIKYHIKLRYSWVEESAGSARMILDSLNAVPDFVNKGIDCLSPNYGGERWGTPGGWHLAVMD